MRIPESQIQAIADKLNIADIVGEYVSLKSQGGRLWGLCPFHGEKTPSFSVAPDKGLFYCFGCQKGGNLFTFVMEMEKLTFMEAAKFLAEKAGVSLVLGDDNREELKRDALKELHDRVAGSLHYILRERPEAAEARRYLQARGLTMETLEAFKIGYAPADRLWLYAFLSKRSYSSEFLAASGLFSAKNPRAALYSNRIIFPITDQHGRVIALGGRTLDESGPKYMNSPETEIFRKGENLFGLDKALAAIRESGQFIVVEGYTDVLALYQAGVRNAVAPLGTAFTEAQARRLRRYTEHGVLLFDGDSAGSAATAKAIVLCERVGVSAEVVELPEGLDPAEILQKQGPEALHNSVKCPINSFVYLVRKALDRHNIGEPEGKEAVLRELTQYIDTIDSDIKKDGCLTLLADALQVERSAVVSDYERFRKGDSPERTSERGGQAVARDNDLFLMLAVAANRSYFPYVRSRIQVDDLDSKRGRTLWIALEECFRSGDETVGGLLQSVDDEDLRALVIERLSGSEFAPEDPDKMVRESVQEIKRRSLQKRRREVELRLRVAQTEGRPIDEMNSLVADKAHFDGELEKLEGD